jgi:dihydrofolate synthase/folylpolyglutamate synthase
MQRCRLCGIVQRGECIGAGFAPQDLAAIAMTADVPARPFADVAAALVWLSSTWSETAPPRILICGSLYLAGSVLADNGTPPE